jgi:hypothetical protein
MHRIAGVGALFLALVCCATAQEAQNTPQTPEDAFSTRQLIAWSSLQKPQPAPQPLPPRDTPIPQPNQPPEEQPKSPGNAQGDHSPAQLFTGKIVKQAAGYVLRAASNTTYELDTDGDLKRFEDQNVRVTGSLEAGTNRIHVTKIELLS